MRLPLHRRLIIGAPAALLGFLAMHFSSCAGNRPTVQADQAAPKRIPDTVPERVADLPGADRESGADNQERRFGAKEAQGRKRAEREEKEARRQRLGYVDSKKPVFEPPAIDLIWMTGPISDAAPTGITPASTSEMRALGARLYADRCAICHGEKGTGRGVHAPSLGTPPNDFTKAVFKLRSTPSGTLPSDRDLFMTITRGMHGTAMAPWFRLDEKQRWALVMHIKAFSPRFREEKPGASVPVPMPPAETQELAARGRVAYENLRCGACHGSRGAADGPAAGIYAPDQSGRPVRIRDFTRGQFMRGSEMTDVYLTLMTGLDGTPMGAYPAVESKDLWALAAFVRTLVRQWPLPEVLDPARRPVGHE